MHYYFTAVSLVAGICLGFGILYLFIGLRRKDNKPLNLTFAIFALCYAITLFNGIRWYSSATVTEYVAINRLDSIFVTGAFVSLGWYIAYYTGVRPRIFLGGVSAAFIVPSLVLIVSPATFTGEVSGLTEIPLPWGETLANLDAAGSIWLDVVLLARLILLGYIIFALFRQFWRGERRPALILGLGILPFIAGIFYEVLGESGVMPYIPFGELGFLGIAIAASLQMSNSVIKTEEALDRHRLNLEGLVETRTAELSQSNEQLKREIERRERAEVVLRESEATARALLNAPTDAAALLDPAGIVLDANEAMAHRYDRGLPEFVGTNIWELMPPDVAERSHAAMRQVIDSSQPVRFEDVRAGIWNDSVIYPVFDSEGHISKVAIMAHDITDRKRAEQALNRRVEELAILHQTAQTVANVTDLSATLEQVAEMIAYVFNVLSTRIAVLADGEKKLKLLAGFVREPVPPEATTTSSHPVSELPITGEILNTGESRVVYDVQSLSLPPSISETVAALNIYSILLVPLMTHGTARGILSISTDEVDRRFSKNEVQLAETIANDVAAAVENSRLLEQAKETAAIEERNRIARELHDSVTQTMYSVSIVAEALPRMMERNLEEAKRNAGYLRQTTLGALAEMRTLLFELRPDSLVKARLNVLLQQLADALTSRTRVPVEVTIHGQASLPVEVKIAFYRIAQEAFNNINKHANATRAWITLHREPDQAILAIRDNGQGFDLESIPEARLGLGIIRERAGEIGASFELESAPGQGTQVKVTWTVSAEEEVPT